MTVPTATATTATTTTASIPVSATTAPTALRTPVAPTEFHLCSASIFTGLIDFASREGNKFYSKATSSLFKEEQYDCSPENMHCLLRVLNQRAKENGRNDDGKGILNIPENHRDPRSKRHYMPDEYGQVSLEKIATYENSYLGGNTREVQNSYMLFYTSLLLPPRYDFSYVAIFSKLTWPYSSDM